MPSQPLQPFSPPTHVLESLHLSSSLISAEKVVWTLLYLVCAYWIIYTLVALYHWFRYSHGSWLGIPAVAIHLALSYVLIVYTFTGTIVLHLP